MVCAYVREIIHSLKIVDYLPVHTHKPSYNNVHLLHFSFILQYLTYNISQKVSKKDQEIPYPHAADQHTAHGVKEPQIINSNKTSER